MKKLIVVLAVLLLVASPLLVVGCGGDGEADGEVDEAAAIRDSIESFWDAYNAEEYARCLTYSIGDMDEGEMLLALAMAKGLTGEVVLESISDIAVKNSSATAMVTATFGGETFTDQVSLVKVDRKWKLVWETEEEDSTATPTATPSPSPTPTPTPAATLTPTPTPTPSPTPIPGHSRSSPAPARMALVIEFDDFMDTYEARITLLETVRGGEAWDRIKAANMFNAPPSEGFEYVLAKVRFEYLASPAEDKAYAVSPVQFTAVSTDGKDYDMSWAVEPEPALNAQLYEGASHEGWAAFLVAAGDTTPLMTFGRNYDGTGGIWFQLY